MKLDSYLRLLTPLLLLGACSSQPAQGEPRPALLSEPGPEVRDELRRVVSEAMHGVQVTLAEDALTRESLLIIERKPQQPRLSGRELARPTKFRLMTDGSSCWLQRLPDNSRWPLVKASCIPEPGAQ